MSQVTEGENSEPNQPKHVGDLSTGKQLLVLIIFLVLFASLIVTIVQLIRGDIITAVILWIIIAVTFYAVPKSMGVSLSSSNSESDNSGSRSHAKNELDSHVANDSGKYVTAERVNKILDVLEEDEQVMYLLRGSQIDVEGSGSGESFWGNDRSRKHGSSGWVRTAITNKRVVTKIPQILGNDERSVPYHSIVSTDLDTALGVKRISLQTAGSTYHIEAGHPDREECREATRYIRQKISEANEPQIVQETPETDPIEQIEQLKRLHESGTLTDEEFEDKKQALLERI